MFGRGYPWLGLALKIRSLTDALIEVVEPKDEPQLKLFPVTMEMRNEFSIIMTTFARCLHPNTIKDGFDWDFVGAELYDFVQHWSYEEHWKDVLRNTSKICRGEPLTTEEYLTLIAFFDELERRALSNGRHCVNDPGGCF
jgi:hypothetical protein